MKFINKIFPLLVVAASLASCEKKVVDVRPIDVIPSAVAIQTITDVGSAVNGVYGTWSARRSVYINSVMTDEVRLGTGTEYRNVGSGLFGWTNVSDAQDWRDTETGGVFTNLYQVIDRVNRVLEFSAPIVPANATEDALKTQYRGEMLALRGMAHLELLRFYSETTEYAPDRAGVVVQTEYVKAPGAYFPRRNTQAEVVAAITSDLATARTLIPTSFTNISRITRNAVIASQVRLAQHIKSWQEVVDRANEVITAQPITPRASYEALWTARTLAENQSTEVIWKYNISIANLGNAVGTLFQDASNGAVQASPSTKLMNTYDRTNDIRFSVFFRTTPRDLIAKYGAFITGNGENFQYDLKLIRTSEILLARAEAYAELNNTASANTDLAALRSARITGYAHTAITDKLILINQILNERYKELCYEGTRYHDLRRRSLPIVRDVADIGGVSTSLTLPITNPKYILPIPQQELFANPNYGQNPGY